MQMMCMNDSTPALGPRRELHEPTFLNSLLHCQYILLEFLAALYVAIVLAECVELAEEPGLFHCAGQGEDVFGGANLLQNNQTEWSIKGL